MASIDILIIPGCARVFEAKDVSQISVAWLLCQRTLPMCLSLGVANATSVCSQSRFEIDFSVPQMQMPGSALYFRVALSVVHVWDNNLFAEARASPLMNSLRMQYIFAHCLQTCASA